MHPQLYVQCACSRLHKNERKKQHWDRAWSSRRRKRIDADTKIERNDLIIFLICGYFFHWLSYASRFVMTDEAIHSRACVYLVFVWSFEMCAVFSTRTLWQPHSSFAQWMKHESSQSYISCDERRKMTYTELNEILLLCWAEITFSLSDFCVVFLLFSNLSSSFIIRALGLENLNLMSARCQRRQILFYYCRACTASITKFLPQTRRGKTIICLSTLSIWHSPIFISHVYAFLSAALFSSNGKPDPNLEFDFAFSINESKTIVNGCVRASIQQSKMVKIVS